MTIKDAHPVDQWLLEHLIHTGRVTESGVSRKAAVRLCPAGCKAWVLIGLDDPAVAAIEARVDPQPLSALGEALALVEGRYTEALHREGGRYVLDPRHALDIAARPAGTSDREDVLRQHRCGSRALVAGETAPSVFVQIEHVPTSDEPPF